MNCVSSDTNWKVSLFMSFEENNEETLKGVSFLSIHEKGSIFYPNIKRGQFFMQNIKRVQFLLHILMFIDL